MANKSILEYLRETPYNTNVNVVKGMIGNSGDGEKSEAKITIMIGENDNLYLSEEDITFLQSLPPVYNINQYNIYVYLSGSDIRLLGLLETVMSDRGQPTNYLYTGQIIVDFYNNTFNKSVNNCFIIDTSNNYSVIKVN